MRAVGGGAPIALAAPNIHCDVWGGYGRNHLDATTPPVFRNTGGCAYVFRNTGT